MKITDKVFKRFNLVLCFLPLIYVIISDNFNINISKYTKFLGVCVMCIANMLLSIGYHLTNKPIKKKDLIGLILGNLAIAIVLIWWYVRFVY